MKKLMFILTAVLAISLAGCKSMPKDSEAFIVSKQIVEAKVNAPGMKFPFADYRYDVTSDSLYIVESHFDSNNNRMNYRVKMYYKGGDWSEMSNWKIKEFQTW